MAGKAGTQELSRGKQPATKSPGSLILQGTGTGSPPSRGRRFDPSGHEPHYFGRQLLGPGVFSGEVSSLGQRMPGTQGSRCVRALPGLGARLARRTLVLVPAQAGGVFQQPNGRSSRDVRTDRGNVHGLPPARERRLELPRTVVRLRGDDGRFDTELMVGTIRWREGSIAAGAAPTPGWRRVPPPSVGNGGLRRHTSPSALQPSPLPRWNTRSASSTVPAGRCACSARPA